MKTQNNVSTIITTIHITCRKNSKAHGEACGETRPHGGTTGQGTRGRAFLRRNISITKRRTFASTAATPAIQVMTVHFHLTQTECSQRMTTRPSLNQHRHILGNVQEYNPSVLIALVTMTFT